MRHISGHDFIGLILDVAASLIPFCAAGGAFAACVLQALR